MHLLRTGQVCHEKFIPVCHIYKCTSLYKGKDGYTSVASRMLAQLDLEEDEELSWGGLCPRVEVEEIELEIEKADGKEWWEYRLKDQDLIQGRNLVYSDGSKLEDGKVGGGWYGEEETGSAQVGNTATVWDGEIAGMLGAAETFKPGAQIVLLTDSKAAINAVKKVGSTGKARTADFKRLLKVIKGRRDATVTLGWV